MDKYKATELRQRIIDDQRDVQLLLEHLDAFGADAFRVLGRPSVTAIELVLPFCQRCVRPFRRGFLVQTRKVKRLNHLQMVGTLLAGCSARLGGLQDKRPDGNKGIKPSRAAHRGVLGQL